MKPIITLTTDFGHKDNYVGVVKGAILSICPQARIVDICHEIPAWNIRAGAWVIDQAYSYFPRDTIHMVVVDPNVGLLNQRSIAVISDYGTFVGPDNGVLTFALDGIQNWRAFELTNRDLWLVSPIDNETSTTFHARDIYGPVSGHLAQGITTDSLGAEIAPESLVASVVPKAIESGGNVMGEVVYIDRYGNLATNISRSMILAGSKCFLDERLVGEVSKTFASAKQSMPAAFVASHGHLEIAVYQGNASEALGAELGSIVRLESA